MAKSTSIRFILSLLFFSIGLNGFSQTQTIYTPDTYTAEVEKNALRYKGKEFVVRGIVDDINGGGTSYTISLQRRTAFFPLFCVFEGETVKESLKNIIKGDTITITGICENSVYLQNCVITDTRQPKPPEPQESIYTPEKFAAYVDAYKFAAEGKIFSIRGRIETIGEAMGWNRAIQGYMVIFKTPGSSSWVSSVRCYFSTRQQDKLLEYSAGDIVTITGEYERGEGLINCSINK